MLCGRWRRTDPSEPSSPTPRPRWPPASKTATVTGGVALWRRRTRCRAPGLLPLPLPGDRRSGAISRPVHTPKCAWTARKRRRAPSSMSQRCRWRPTVVGRGITELRGAPRARRPRRLARRSARTTTASRSGAAQVSVGDAVQPDRQAVGLQVFRRLHTALGTLPGRDCCYASDPEGSGAEGCASTPGPEPVPGPRTGGSLPSQSERPVRHGRTGRWGQKTLPRQRMNESSGAHRRSAEVRIDPSCRLRAQVRV